MTPEVTLILNCAVTCRPSWSRAVMRTSRSPTRPAGGVTTKVPVRGSKRTQPGSSRPSARRASKRSTALAMVCAKVSAGIVKLTVRLLGKNWSATGRNSDRPGRPDSRTTTRKPAGLVRTSPSAGRSGIASAVGPPSTSAESKGATGGVGSTVVALLRRMASMVATGAAAGPAAAAGGACTGRSSSSAAVAAMLPSSRKTTPPPSSRSVAIAAASRPPVVRATRRKVSLAS